MTYSILTGLTPLIPIPLLDDVVYSQLKRDMTRRLAGQSGLKPSSADVKVLSDDPGGNCLLGCLGGVAIYLVKKIFRKIFFFLEWKRAADIISETYYQGYLLDIAFSEGLTGKHGAENVRKAMDKTLERTNTSVVNRAAWGVIRQSKSGLKQLVALLLKALPHQNKDLKENEVSQAVEDVEKTEGGLLGRLSQLFEQALKSLPAEHFAQVRSDFLREVSAPTAGIR